MINRIKSGVVFYTVALGLIAAFHSHTAYAQVSDAFVSGGQICSPLSNNTEGVDWRSAGILNNSDESRWVVCPIVFNRLTNNFDVGVTLVNLSDATIPVGGYRCVVKINNLFGDAVDEEPIENDEESEPGGSFTLTIVGFVIADNQSASISCQLPAGTGLTRVVVDITN